MSQVKKKEKTKSPYEKCLHFSEENNTCGPFKRWNKDGLFSVDDLTADVSNHLQSLKVNVLVICL